MVVVAAIALGSSTYAWFAINGKVTATGMDFTTTVQNNLFIANDAGNTKSAEANFGTTINQKKGGLLQPVSTVDGISYFYSKTTNVLASGNVKEMTWDTYDANNTTAFDANYNTSGAKGYYDYVYQLKGVAAAETNINLNKLDLIYGGTSNNDQKAYRVAVFAQDITTTTAGTVATSDLIKIYSVENATNFEDGKAVNSTTTRANVSAANVQLKIKAPTVSGYENGTYYKITVRLWLEGDDNTCNNTTFMKLDDKWRLDMGWAIDDVAVTYITQTETTTKYTITAGTPVSDVAFTISGQNYYDSGSTINTSTKVYVMSNAAFNSTSNTRFFTYEGGNLTEITNQVTVQ